MFSSIDSSKQERLILSRPLGADKEEKGDSTQKRGRLSNFCRRQI